MTRKNENLTVGANNYASLQNEKFLNQDFNKINKINKISFYCHSELVSESPDINKETLKRVQGVLVSTKSYTSNCFRVLI